MAAPTRQQLRRNELSEFLVKTRATLEKYSTPIAIALGGVVLLIVVVRLWTWSHAQGTEAAWGQFADVSIETGADNTEAIAALRAIDVSGDARLAEAVRHRLGCALIQQAAFDPGRADACLSEAESLLKEIAASVDAAPGMSASANFALAAIHETRREFDAAKAIYEAVAADARLRGSPFVKLAASRLADLDELRRPVEMLPGSPPPPAPASAPATEEGATTSPASGAAPASGVP